MKQYRTLAAIGFILFLSWTLFICHAVSQVKFTQLERSSIKWTIPVAKRVVPGIPDFVMTYMTLANLIDSTEIELGTKIDSMKWATGDTLKLYTSDGVFKTKITFTGMGTVINVTGTSPIIVTGTSTVTPNVTLDTTSATGAGTKYDLSLKQDKLTGTNGQTLRFTGTNTVAASSTLWNDGTSVGIGTTAPSVRLHVNGDFRLTGKLYDAYNNEGSAGQVLTNLGGYATEWTTIGFLDTLNGLIAGTQTFATGTSGTDFNISSSGSTHTFNFPNASGTNRGLLTSSDWTLFNGKENALTFNAPLTRSTNTISLGAATTSTSGYLSSTDWNTFNAKVSGSGTATRVAFWSGTSTLSSNANLYWDNTNSRLGIGTASPLMKLDVSGDVSITGGSALYSFGTGNAGSTDARWGNFYNSGSETRFLTSGKGTYSSAVPDMYFSKFNGSNVTDMMFIKSSNGNVGIGTITPNTNLELKGSSFTGGLPTDNSFTTGSALTLNNNTGSGTIASINYSTIPTFELVPDVTKPANGVRMGTFNVLGTGDMFFQLAATSSTGYSYFEAFGGEGLVLGTGEAKPIHFRPNRNTAMTILSGGNVGIGNISPQRKLHVTGEVRVTDLTTDTPTGLVGHDADGDLGSVGLSGLSIVSGVLTNSNTGTVTSVGITGSDFNITGSPVTTSGNIGLEIATGVVGPTELASTAVTAGSYTNLNATIDADGRVTSAANGTAGVTTLAAIGSTANANGATISGSTLNLQPASASFGGVVTTGSQTFAGSKTFDYLGGTEGTNLTTGTSLIMATNAGKLENLYGTVAGYDLPLYNPTGNNWELTKLKTVNGNSLLGSGNVALTTDLSFTGASSPYTLNSNTGNDVTFAAGSGVTLSRSGDQLTIAASGMTSWNLAASGTAGSASITNGSTATITAGSGITATRSGNNITISSAAAGGEQFWTTTTNATSHEIILKDHAGTTNVSALKLIEGAGIELTTSAGTFSNSNLTINTVGTAVGQMHKEGVTTVSFTAVTPQKVALTTSFTSGSGISTSDANDRITVASSGKYMITYSLDVDMNATTFGLTAYVKVSGSTDLSASYKQYNNDTNLTPLSKTFYVDLTAGQYIELWLSNSHTVSNNSLWDPILTIQRVQ